MSLFDIIALSLIVTVFVTFGLVLGGLSWYCRNSRKPVRRSADHRRHQDDFGVIVDD